MEKFENDLSFEEIEELKGGCKEMLMSDDILNNNSFSGCTCTYKNLSTIENRNGVSGCGCTCI